MNHVIRILKIIILSLIFIAFFTAFKTYKDDNPLRIDKMPQLSNEISNALIPEQHIRFEKRPDDPFEYPIKLGEIGPKDNLFSGPTQYPFICMTESNGFGQPEIDNLQGIGTPIYPAELDKNQRNRSLAIGFSKDCLLKTGIMYYVIRPDKSYQKYTGKLQDDETLVRLEYGSINRFIYVIAMPITLAEIDKREAKSLWNNKLIFQFGGGSGIGFRQGKVKLKYIFKRLHNQLKSGYAVVTSSGNRTSYTYNMLLAEDTARRVKKQFSSLYGNPEYTVGIGGSGGGLAQYLLQQNSPGLLDAAIPMYSYPDMVSQAIYTLDCDLLNNFYSFRADDSDSWQNMEKRQLLDGLVALNGETHPSAIFQPINQILQGQWPNFPQGNSECINGWFGLYALIHNPKQGWLRDYFSKDIVENNHWNYWQDLKLVYGINEQGFARHLWGNEGIQYGLMALNNQQLSIDEFLEINKKIGSWKQVDQMKPEKITKIPFTNKALWLSLWGRHNIKQYNDKMAPRHPTDHIAVENAYRYGQIYLGLNEIPTLDLRHYLEDELNMHHVSASLQIRQRIEQWQGSRDNHVIWVFHKDFDPITRAFSTIDNWLKNKTRPSSIEDACFDQSGHVLAEGKDVWDGQWNQKMLGDCQRHYNIYSTSRIQAGGPWAGNIFDCTRIPVDQAFKQGLYNRVDMYPYIDELKRIFPNGVCDFNQPDQAKPTDLVYQLFQGNSLTTANNM